MSVRSVLELERLELTVIRPVFASVEAVAPFEWCNDRLDHVARGAFGGGGADGQSRDQGEERHQKQEEQPQWSRHLEAVLSKMILMIDDGN